MKQYTVEKRKIPSTGRDIKILIFRPTAAKKAPSRTPGVLWIHGGGYATGMAEMAYFSRPLALVKKYGAVVVCVNYRLSIETPYPAALEDCHSALCWMKEHAVELGINDSQIMVGGESAGGGLTAALCMYARDKRTVNIAYQMPLYPMLDDRDTESSRDNHAPIWNTKRNHAAWKLYLKGLTEIPPYAAPARQVDYSNLPPAYTFVGDIEPFYCETRATSKTSRRLAWRPAWTCIPTGFMPTICSSRSRPWQSRPSPSLKSSSVTPRSTISLRRIRRKLFGGEAEMKRCKITVMKVARYDDLIGALEEDAE